jgi:hypothetical protein
VIGALPTVGLSGFFVGGLIPVPLDAPGLTVEPLDPDFGGVFVVLVSLSIIALAPAPRTAPVAAPVKVFAILLPPLVDGLVMVGNLVVPVPLVVLVVGEVVVDVKGLVGVPVVALPAMTELGLEVDVIDFGVVLVPNVGTAVLVVGVLVVVIGLEPEPTLVMFEVPTKEDAGDAPVPTFGLSTVPTSSLEGKATLVKLGR